MNSTRGCTEPYEVSHRTQRVTGAEITRQVTCLWRHVSGYPSNPTGGSGLLESNIPIDVTPDVDPTENNIREGNV